MKAIRHILLGLLLVCHSIGSQAQNLESKGVDFCGIKYEVPSIQVSNPMALPYRVEGIEAFRNSIDPQLGTQLLSTLQSLKANYRLDDWIYYQLIRKTAQQIAPKQVHYDQYTLAKWWLLEASGYKPLLRLSDDHILLYIQSNDNIYNLPSLLVNGETFICLNVHDYPAGLQIDNKHFITYLSANSAQSIKHSFSYKVRQLPDFPVDSYTTKSLGFTFDRNRYEFTIRVNPQVQAMFANYPVTDYENYFNIPMSKETYNSLIPVLKKELTGLTVAQGVDYLMRFTRYAFIYTSDQKQFGVDKRFSPEQTLLYGQSDCDDRAGLFFFLIKEIYDLPMLVLSYPAHVTIAVQIPHAKGTSVQYNGHRYLICEPTPQRIDLNLGQILPELKEQSYEIVYAYQPHH